MRLKKRLKILSDVKHQKGNFRNENGIDFRNSRMENYNDIIKSIGKRSVKFWCKKHQYSPEQMVRSLSKMKQLGMQVIQNLKYN